MVMQLPIAKLGSLLVKTLAKPMAKRVKHTFQQNAVTKNMLIGLGQASHIVTTRMTIWSAGYKVRSIQPLETDKALTQGADLIGEAFIFTVGGGLIIWEYNKSKEKDRLKEEKAKLNAQMQKDELCNLKARMDVLEEAMKKNQIQLLQALEEQKLSLGQGQGQGHDDNNREVSELKLSGVRRRSGWFW